MLLLLRLRNATSAVAEGGVVMLRRAWVSSAQPRVLCSFAELRALRGQALKFPLYADKSTQQQMPVPSLRAAGDDVDTTSTSPPSQRRVRQQALATGFVFLCEESAQPRAFVNSCPHARLELDLDDSDFFCEGFVQCKAHGAFFDPQTGMCLQGPTGARSGRQTAVPGLAPLDVRVDANGDVVLLFDGLEQLASRRPRSRATKHIDSSSERDAPDTAVPDGVQAAELCAYRTEKQRQLAAALASRTHEVREIQDALHAKAMARIHKYREQQRAAAVSRVLSPPSP